MTKKTNPTEKRLSQHLYVSKNVEFNGAEINKFLFNPVNGRYPFSPMTEDSLEVESLEDLVEFVSKNPDRRFSVNVNEEGTVFLNSYTTLEVGMTKETTKKLLDFLKKD